MPAFATNTLQEDRVVEEKVKEKLSTQPCEEHLTQKKNLGQIEGFGDGLSVQIVPWLKLLTPHISFSPH